jgi:FkbM family methyltransferase
MRKIFLDIGAYNGVSAEFFLANHPQADEFEIYSFECDKRNIEIIESKNLPITLIEAAAWSRDGYVDYYYGKDDGGTMYPQKNTGNINPKNKFYTECIDLAGFIRNNFIKSDYIILKLNCEGAEYELIPHLKSKNIIDWINKWYIRWHVEKIGIDFKLHETIQSMVPKYYDWRCQGGDPDFIDIFKNSLNENN